MADMFARIGNIIPVGSADLKSDDLTPKYAKGIISFTNDIFGVRMFRYLHNQAASAANTVAGGLYKRAAVISTVVVAAGTTTTNLVTTAAAFTASAVIGRVAYMKTNSVTAGAAPEGESGNIVANGTANLALDPARPLSAVPNVADTIQVVALWDFIKAAAATDLAIDVFGVPMGVITNGNWGMLQMEGPCPDVLCNPAAAIVAKAAVVADAERVVTAGAATSNKWVGWAMEAVNATNRGFLPVWLHLRAPTAG